MNDRRWWETLAGGPEIALPDRLRRGRGVMLVVVITIAVVILISLSAPFRLAEARAFDYLSTLVLPDVPDDAPIIVAIDEPSLAEIGRQWPWPRHLHGRLIAALREAGARAIGVDIIFAEPSNPGADAGLAVALGPDIVLAADENLIETPHAMQHIRVDPLPEFTARGAVSGVASISLDGDATLRRIPAYPDSFARALLAIAGKPEAQSNPGDLVQVFGPSRTIETVSYYQALDPESFLPSGTFRDRIVILGLSMQSAPSVNARGADAYATSFTALDGKLVSGAEIQATILTNLHQGLFIKPAERQSRYVATVIAALLAGLLVWNGTSWRTAVWGLFAIVTLTAGSFALLHWERVYLAPLSPALAFVVVASAQSVRDYASERRLRRGITRAFSQYLSPVMVERLARDPSLLKLGGERRTLSILFSDIRGFTTIAEGMKDSPERLTTLINRLLTPLSDIVMESGGTIDKYMGDCIMAFWNAPLDDPDHAAHAVEAGLKMLAALDDLNAELAAEAMARGESPVELAIGVGINTGDCVVGNMGSAQRFDYSVLGDAVNLASRLENETRSHGVPILLGPETARRVAGRFALQELGSISVKGKREPVTISTVDGAAAAPFPVEADVTD